MSEMLRLIIVFLMEAEIDFEVQKVENNIYIIYSPKLNGKMSVWYVKDSPSPKCPRLYSYLNNYKMDFASLDAKDYIRQISNIEFDLPI